MRKTVSVLSAAMLAAAFAAPAAAELKFGVLDPGQVVASPVYRSAQAKFTAEAQKRENEIKTEGTKLEADMERFRREGDTMSPQQRTDTDKNLYNRRRDFEAKQRQYSEELQKQRAESSRDFNAKVQRALAEVAREKGLDVILENAAYYDRSLDVTADVLAKIGSYGDPPAASKGDKKGDKKK